MESGLIVSTLSGTAGALVGAIAVLSGVYAQDRLSARREKVSIREQLEGELDAVCYLLLENRWWWAYSWEKRNVCARKKVILERMPEINHLEIADNYDELKFWRVKELAKSEKLDEVLGDMHRLLVKIRQNFTEDEIRQQCIKLSELDLSKYFFDPPKDRVDSLEKLSNWQKQINRKLTETNKIWERELKKLLLEVRKSNRRVSGLKD